MSNAALSHRTLSHRTLAHVALFAALIAVLGLIPKIDLPFGVPVTAQTLGVMLAGCLLGPWRGLAAVLLFEGAVALGLPLLAGGRGGFGVFLGPTVGFLVGWTVGAVVCGLVLRHLPGPIVVRAFVASVLGGIVGIYLIGIPGLALMAGLTLEQAALGSLAFVPGDLIKCALTAAVVQTVARGLPEWRTGRA